VTSDVLRLIELANIARHCGQNHLANALMFEAWALSLGRVR
jgi:hypothetical protein